jgi:hypothetical protein
MRSHCSFVHRNRVRRWSDRPKGFFYRWLPGITGVVVVVFLGLNCERAIGADASPDGLENPNTMLGTEPGWSDWKPLEQLNAMDLQSGFYNREVRAYRDFQLSCQTATGLENDQIAYWFRVNDLVGQIGSGQVEYGCWQNGAFLYTETSTVVDASLGNVDCLRVNSPIEGGLRVRAWPGTYRNVIGGIANGETVNPGSFPATIIEYEGRNWVAIATPVQGWVSNGTPGSQGNLELCSPPSE